nr:VanZ family protein [Sphingomonas sp. ID1715]
MFWSVVLATLYATLRPLLVHVPVSDKTQHAVTFGVLMLLAGSAYPRVRLGWLAAALAVFGALIEILQPYFHRDRDVHDWIADCIGILIVVALLWLLRRWLGSDSRHLVEPEL